MKGLPLPDLAPGSPEWLKVMSASKVAAVLGLSPFESRYHLWHVMAGNIPGEVDNALLQRGHYLEPAIAEWFADQHPELHVARCGSFAHPSNPWATAAPDRLLHAVREDGTRTADPVALLEVKTANNEWEWGAPGTDEIPPGYLAQVQWQLWVLGLDLAYVAVLTPYMEFREYVVRYDPADAAFIAREAWAFMRSIAEGEEPDVDDTDTTYAALRQLHPDIEDEDVELDPELAREYLDALLAYEDATAAKQAATNKVAAAMGNARRAVLGTTTYATRQSRRKADGTPGLPYVVAGRGLTKRERTAA